MTLAIRRPAAFPTFEFARLRREVLRQARRSPLDDGDNAVAKIRRHLLSSTIDARLSKPVTGADVDPVAVTVVAESRHRVTFTDDGREQVGGAAWRQYADPFGFSAAGRARQVEAATAFVPRSGPDLSSRLRAIEREAIAALREKPRQR